MIRPEHVQEGFMDFLCCDRRRALLKLSNHHRIIYQLIERNPGITSANLMKAYRERCRELNTPPVARRTFTHYLSRMRDVGLVQEDQARERGRVRCFKLFEKKLSSFRIKLEQRVLGASAPREQKFRSSLF